MKYLLSPVILTVLAIYFYLGTAKSGQWGLFDQSSWFYVSVAFAAAGYLICARASYHGRVRR